MLDILSIKSFTDFLSNRDEIFIKDGMTEIVHPNVISEYIKEQKFPSTLKKGLNTPLYKRMIH